MLVLAEQLQPSVETPFESPAPPRPLEDGIRHHLQNRRTGRLEIYEGDRRLGVVAVSRGNVVWVHSDEHPEPFSQRLARDIGMTAQELGHLLRTYPANKLDLVHVMTQNAPLGPVELREVLFEHSAAHLHTLLRQHRFARTELHRSDLHFATPYEFDFEELVAMGERTAAADGVATVWDVLAGHPDVERAWVLEDDEVPDELREAWPWLEAAWSGLRGDMPSFEWFGVLEDRGYVLLGEDPFVVVAALEGESSSGQFERVWSAVTAARTCVVGLALERVVRRIASAHPGSLLAARLVHEQGGRNATWHHPRLGEAIGGDADEQAQAIELFHTVSTEVLAEGASKGSRCGELYDLHYRSRGGLGVVLLARPGSDISF